MSVIYYFNYYPNDDFTKNIEHYSPTPHPIDFGGTGYFSDVLYHSRNTNARFYVVTFGYEEGWPKKYCPPRTIDRHIMHFVFDGEGECNGVSVKKGDIFITRSNQKYYIMHDAANPMKMGWIGVSGKEVELMIETLHLPTAPLLHMPVAQIEPIRQLFRDTLYEEHPGNDLPYFMFSRFFQVLALSGISYTPEHAITTNYTHSAVNFINTHYMEDITVADIAKAAHISESHLRALYLQELGISPRTAIMQKRIAVAKALLKQNKASIATVAEACGYVDQSAFAKRFKQETGLSPKEWRQRYTQKQS